MILSKKSALFQEHALKHKDMAPISRKVSLISTHAVLKLRAFSYSTLACWLKAAGSAFSGETAARLRCVKWPAFQRRRAICA
jgi:hypothetical protein